MFRIIKKVAIIDMPYHGFLQKHQITAKIAGQQITNFIHDKKSIKKALEKSKFKKYKISLEKIGGRDRLIVYAYK